MAALQVALPTATAVAAPACCPAAFAATIGLLWPNSADGTPARRKFACGRMSEVLRRYRPSVPSSHSGLQRAARPKSAVFGGVLSGALMADGRPRPDRLKLSAPWKP